MVTSTRIPKKPFGMRASRLSAVGLVVASLALPACGDDGARSSEPGRLSAAEESIVVNTQTQISSYCRKVGLFLTRREPLPTPLETRQVNDQADRLIALAREKPEAQFRNHGTLRLFLGDMIEDLDGANCSDTLQARLVQGRATLPQP